MVTTPLLWLSCTTSPPLLGETVTLPMVNVPLSLGPLAGLSVGVVPAVTVWLVELSNGGVVGVMVSVEGLVSICPMESVTRNVRLSGPTVALQGVAMLAMTAPAAVGLTPIAPAF